MGESETSAGASGRVIFSFNSLPTTETARPEVGSGGWKSTARRVVSGAPPATLENPEDRVPFTPVNDLRSMEQCRQGKSAKWIRNLGKRIGCEGLGTGVPVPNPSAVGGLLELLPRRERVAACRPGDGRERSFGDFPRAQMPRHLISDAHEWINEIPTLSCLLSGETTAKGTGLARIGGERRPVELDSTQREQKSRVEQKGKSSFDSISGTNTNRESVAYRSFRPSEFEARGVGKVTTGISGLWQPSVHSDTRLVLPCDDGVAIVIQPSTRGTVDSHNWSSRLVEKPVARSYRALDYD
ncbi:unnamed protein product [Prunus brigantina]